MTNRICIQQRIDMVDTCIFNQRWEVVEYVPNWLEDWYIYNIDKGDNNE